VREAGDGLALALKHYLVNPARHCLVVIEGGDLPAKSTLRKLIEGDKNAVALPCYVQEARDLKGMMIERLRAAGLTIDPDALALWADAVAGDYQQVNGEIEKLLTYMGVDGSGRVRVPARVSEADVRAVTAGMGTASMDGFIDAWLLGRSEAAMTHLARLLDDGVALVAVARAILYHTRKIESTHHAIAAGASLDAILEGRDAPVFFKRKAAFAQQVRRWPIPKLSRLMHEVFLAEAKLKSGVDPDASVPQALLALSRRVG
jgi:DNA polymerase-3 subunit delta